MYTASMSLDSKSASYEPNPRGIPWRAANASAFCCVRDATALTSTPSVCFAGARSPYGTTLAVPNTPKRIIDRLPSSGKPTRLEAAALKNDLANPKASSACSGVLAFAKVRGSVTSRCPSRDGCDGSAGGGLPLDVSNRRDGRQFGVPFGSERASPVLAQAMVTGYSRRCDLFLNEIHT